MSARPFIINPNLQEMTLMIRCEGEGATPALKPQKLITRKFARHSGWWQEVGRLGMRCCGKPRGSHDDIY